MAVVQQAKLSSEDLDHRVRQTLNRKLDLIVKAKARQKEIEEEMHPLKQQLKRAQKQEEDAREAVKDLFADKEIENGRFVLEHGVMETTPRLLSVEVTDDKAVPHEFAEQVTEIKVDKVGIKKAWEEFDGTAEEFYASICPGVTVMEGPVSVKVII